MTRGRGGLLTCLLPGDADRSAVSPDLISRELIRGPRLFVWPCWDQPGIVIGILKSRQIDLDTTRIDKYPRRRLFLENSLMSHLIGLTHSSTLGKRSQQVDVNGFKSCLPPHCNLFPRPDSIRQTCIYTLPCTRRRHNRFRSRFAIEESLTCSKLQGVVIFRSPI